QHVAVFFRVVVGEGVGVDDLVDEFHQAVAAVHLRCGLSHDPPRRATTIAGDVVPDGLQAVLRNGESNGCVQILQAVAAAYQLGLGGVALRCVVNALRHGGTAPGLEDR